MRRRQVWMAAVGTVLLAIVPATTSLSQTGTTFDDVTSDVDDTTSDVEENTSDTEDTSTSQTQGTSSPSVSVEADASQSIPSLLIFPNNWRLEAGTQVSVDPAWAPQEIPVDGEAGAGYEGMIPLGYLSSRDALQCVEKDQCTTEEDLAYTYVDVSDTMEELEDPDTNTHFSVKTDGPSLTTYWMVCTWDGNGQLLDCHRDDPRPGFGYRIDIDDDAREVGLFPLMSAYNDYEIEMWAY